MNEKENYINNLKETLTYSVSKFDTQTLTISGASLAFSLTFIKDIVPFSKAIYIPIFYLSLILFLVTVFLGLYGHYLSMKKTIKVIELAQKDDFEGIMEMKDKTNTINAIVITSLSLGILSLIIYCVINIEKERKIGNNQEGKITFKNKNIEVRTDNYKSIIYKDSLNSNFLKIAK